VSRSPLSRLPASVWTVIGATNSVAFRVMTTLTVAPA